jgi:hypothetical protein
MDGKMRHIDILRYRMPPEATMNATPELVALIERERVQHRDKDRLARLAARVRSCCSISRIDRLARRLHLAPTSR